MADKSQSGSSEPSMEEILSSIRKIISEDSGGEGQSDKGESVAVAADDEEEVLDLTEEVAEPEAFDLTDDEDDQEAVSNLEDLADSLDAEAAASGRGEDDDFELSLAPEDDDEERQPFEPEEAFAKPLEDEPAAEEPADDVFAEEPAALSDPAAFEEPVVEMPSRRGTPDLSIVSPETEDAAKSALARLARASDAQEYGDDEPKSDSDRILERMVREALEPHLKAWLDENLPRLVERVVREEIRRMTRRAEALAADEDTSQL